VIIIFTHIDWMVAKPRNRKVKNVNYAKSLSTLLYMIIKDSIHVYRHTMMKIVTN